MHDIQGGCTALRPEDRASTLHDLTYHLRFIKNAKLIMEDRLTVLSKRLSNVQQIH